MKSNYFNLKNLIRIIAVIAVFYGLYLSSRYNYLLFHSIVEIFSIVIAGAIFIFAWNSRRMLENSYFIIIGIAYLFVGGIDFIHTLAYKGMPIFTQGGSNLPTQLWIGARYIEYLSILVALLAMRRKINPGITFSVYIAVVFLLLSSIFYWHIFPTAFVEGQGLTAFKVGSEYIISTILLASVILLWRNHAWFDITVFRLLLSAIIITIASEMSFTLYTDVYGIANAIGHFLKIISFYLVYKAILEIGLTKPYAILMKDLKEKTLELEQANIHLREVDQLKSVFLASMSHELRTPLNSIIGFTGILLMGMSGELNDEQKKQLTMAKNSANHLLSLINDLLDVSKIEAEKVELSLEEFRLDDVVKEVVDMHSTAAAEKGLELSTGVPGNIALQQDRRRTKQVMVNLVSNAMKFTSAGGVGIAATVVGEGKVEIRVTDTGIGIKEERMHKLFQPFQQIDMSLTKKYEGTGLGLYLSKKLVTLLGGDISVKSQYGKGSEFSFTLPLRYSGGTRQ